MNLGIAVRVETGWEGHDDNLGLDIMKTRDGGKVYLCFWAVAEVTLVLDGGVDFAVVLDDDGFHDGHEGLAEQ